MLKTYEADYSMGGIADGGFFRSIVVAENESEIKTMLHEEHAEDISRLIVIPANDNKAVKNGKMVVSTIRR